MLDCNHTVYIGVVMVFTEYSDREWALQYTDNIVLITNRPLNFATNVLFSL